jgi:hypothetical protein
LLELNLGRREAIRSSVCGISIKPGHGYQMS